MDLDKSLYMAEFLKMREDIGTVEIYPVKNTLFTNLYDDFKPKEEVKEVKEVIEEIGDKTIHLLKKEDQPVFFPDLPELEESMEDIPEIKNIKVSEGVHMIGGGTSVKTISFDPNYVAKG
jgi:hypothetical protein